MTDERDGKVYRTVQIGDQIWMAENLNYADSVKTPSLLERSWCYDNKTENCDVAGRLYTWAAAIDSVKLATDADYPQDCGAGKHCILPDTVYGVCPPGWHLPSYDEWETLFTAVGGQSTAGKVLKSQTGWTNKGNGTDAFAFSALPAGYRHNNEYYDQEGITTSFWSSTESEDSGGWPKGFRAFAVLLLYNFDGADWPLGGQEKSFGFSVRCVKDEE